MMMMMMMMMMMIIISGKYTWKYTQQVLLLPFFFFFFFFFFWHYNPTWVLVLCTRSLQAFLRSTSCIKSLSFRFFKSCITSSLHLFFGRPSVLIPTGFQSVILLISFTTSILHTSHYFIFHAFKLTNLVKIIKWCLWKQCLLLNTNERHKFDT